SAGPAIPSSVRAHDESSDPTPSSASRVQKERSRHKFIAAHPVLTKADVGRHVEKRLSGVSRRDEPDTMPMSPPMIPRTLLRSTHSCACPSSELPNYPVSGTQETRRGIHGRPRRDVTSGALHLGGRMSEAYPLRLARRRGDGGACESRPGSRRT